MDIQITTKKSEGVERLLEVSIPVAEVEAVEARTTQRYASQVRLPGFRPGKAPAHIVRKRFKDAIRQQVLETLVQDAYKEVLEREKLQVAAQPHIHDVTFEDGKPVSFELHVEVRPELKLDRVSGFRLTKPKAEIGEAQVQEQLDTLLDQRATFAPVEEKPNPGDMVTVELATAEDGDELPEGKEYRLVIGSGQAIPAIEELILTLAPGETVEQSVRWPDDFPDEAQRGKTKPVRVHLKEVKRKSVPALDDAFAREVGDFEHLDALRAAVESDLRENATREADAAVRQQLLDEIAAANQFDVPGSWVQSLIDSYMQMYKIPDEERTRFSEEFRPVAERQVRRDLIIDAIAEQQQLQASEADVDDRVAEVASKRGAEPGQVYAQLQKAGRLKEIEQGITEDKVFTWLLGQNTID